MKKLILKAFSLVELMVTLIVISCIMAALVPSITKKLRTQGITVGGSGGGNGGDASGNFEFNQDCSAWGAECALCVDDRCSLCTKICESFEYVSTAECVCKSCTDKDTRCISCTSKSCNKCDIGYGLDATTKTCSKCEEWQYSDGANPCTTCPENYYCNGSASVACPSDSYAPAGSTTCTACSATYSNCTTCTLTECLTCKGGYRLKNGACIPASGSQNFTTAGEHSFEVPDGIDKIKVIAVSGGAGGGGGTSTDKTTDFKTTGTNTWNIPLSVRGREIKFSSVGASGGWGWIVEWWVGRTAPGAGYARQNISFTLPNKATIDIVVGAKAADATKGNGCRYSSEHSANTLTSGFAGGSTYFSGYNTATYTAYGGYGGDACTLNCEPVTKGCSHSGASNVGSNIFTTANVGYSRGHVGEHGAMRIFWTEKNPGTGGGTGQIAYNEEVSVIPGETLRVIVGRGGAGGTLGNAGEWGKAEMVSKIIGSEGGVYITSAVSPSSMGATGGNPTSTVGTAGYITNGLTATQITKDGFSGSKGSNVSNLAGGSGGQTILNGAMTHCSVGAGGSGYGVNGGAATGYGGCGGGGAGAGAKGGAGAPGYVKISWGD